MHKGQILSKPVAYCQDLPLPLAYAGDKKVKRFHFSEIIGRLPYVRATVTHIVTIPAYRYTTMSLSRKLRFVLSFYGLMAEVRVEPYTYATDVTLILSKLYSPLGLRGCMSMRLVLNMSMFINFMVDTCGRAYEAVSSIRYPNVYLRWRDVKIYVFKSTGGGIEVTGTLRLTNMKGMKYGET
jgi:hypothetical protein